MTALIVLLLILLDPIPKSDEPLAYRFNYDKSEITFYTPKGERYRQYKMPGDQFLGIHDKGRKLLFFGKNGKLAGDDVKSRSMHVRRLGNETTGEDLRLPVDGDDAGMEWAWWMFTDDLKLALGTEKRNNPNRYTFKIWNGEDGKITKCDYPADFHISGWLKSGRSVYGHLRSDGNHVNKITFPNGKPERLVPFEKEHVSVAGVSPDGRFVLGVTSGSFIDRARFVYLFDLEKETKTAFLHIRIFAEFEAAFSPDGKQIMYAVGNGSVPQLGGLRICDWECFISNADGSNAVSVFKDTGSSAGRFGWVPSRKNFQFADVNAKK